MGKHSDLKNWQARTVVAVVAVVAVGLAVYSAAASYETVSHLAATYGVPLARWTPIGLDGGLFGAIIINIGLIWLKKPVWWFGMVARFFAVAVIAANGAAGWPRPVGIGLRVAAPVLFVIIMEAAQYVLLYRTDAAEAERRQKREERIPLARWILAPAPTFVIWRRKTLWADSHLPQSVIDAELSVIRLADFYGADWRDKADPDLVWMVETGVNMDEVLDRVRKLTGTAATRRQSRAASPAGEYRPVPVPAAPAGPVPDRQPVPQGSTGGAVGDETPRERTAADLLEEARAYRDELAAAGKGERPTKERLRLRLGVSSAKALEVCRALKEDEQNEAREASGAVG